MRLGTLIAFVVGSAGVLVVWGMRHLLGMEVDASRLRLGTPILETRPPAPLGTVRMAGRERGGTEEAVAFEPYSALYRAIGVTAERFGEWERRYGIDSHGVGMDGVSMAPDFPVFSKVAWLFVDEVTLSPEETSSLVGECDRALMVATEPEVRRLIEQIRALALRAAAESLVLEFGHP